MNRKGMIIDTDGSAVGRYRRGIVNSDGSYTDFYKSVIIDSDGSAVTIYKKSVEWTYVMSDSPPSNGVDPSSIILDTYTFSGVPYSGSARVVTADITYTFAESLEMLSGSTLSIWSNNDYPTSIDVYLNGSGTSSYHYDSGEHTGSISFTGNLSSVKIHAAFGNTSGGNYARIKSTINSVGNNSFMLNNANTADL